MLPPGRQYVQGPQEPLLHPAGSRAAERGAKQRRGLAGGRHRHQRRSGHGGETQENHKSRPGLRLQGAGRNPGAEARAGETPSAPAWALLVPASPTPRPVPSRRPEAPLVTRGGGTLLSAHQTCALKGHRSGRSGMSVTIPLLSPPSLSGYRKTESERENQLLGGSEKTKPGRGRAAGGPSSPGLP